LQKRLQNWWRNRYENITLENLRNRLQEASTKGFSSIVRSLFNSCTKKLVRTGVKFSDIEVSRLQAELSDKPAVHLRSDALTPCSILLLDCLETSKCIFVTFESLLSNTNVLLQAWLGGHWEWRIVFRDSTDLQSDISEMCREIFGLIKRAPSSKRAIILSSCSVQQISDFVYIEHILNSEQLSDVSQAIVLDMKKEFRGCEVTMRSVLQRHGNVKHVLGPELVTDLIKVENLFNIGGRL
jgi:hypothetical protein